MESSRMTRKDNYVRNQINVFKETVIYKYMTVKISNK